MERLGGVKEVAVALNVKQEVSYGDQIVLYLDPMDTNRLVVMLCSGFAKCSHWRKLGKELLGFVCIIS